MKTINTIKKVSLATLLTFFLSFSSVFAQNDMMYIMKSGSVVGQYNVNTEVDSVIFYKPTIDETTNGTFTDTRDGNEYNWVKIGDQVWMAENLKYLPSVVRPGTASLTTPYYYVYGYNGTNVTDAKAIANYTTYGVLYNWTAAMNGETSSTVNPSGVQGVCPTGWHLPSDAEWTELTDYLGVSIAGDKLKETGTTHWTSLNTGATNETGFTALPGGRRDDDGTFVSIGDGGIWWSATESGTYYAWYRSVSYRGSSVTRNRYSKELGYSVRCVRD
ncbi:MAG: fibrobacter succinogenes major paralogous domain-containing protein [Prolixibacteraceae bacterium]|jgi:uncharacterized protein (TIGR02145 family)|nr:fibrobacter succinogenes major paralogous domain-containing protein [Prolixibacteraceae bacterium]